MEETANQKLHILKEKMEKKITVIVCAKSQEIRNMIQKREDIIAFFR